MHEPVSREVLDSYGDSASGNYFIPLGILELGNHRLDLCFETSVPLRVEVVNEWFDFLVDHCSGCGCGDFSQVLEVEEESRHYLRLRSQDPIFLQEIKLGPD